MTAPLSGAADRWPGWRAVWASGVPRAVLGLAVAAGFGALFVLRTDLGELRDSLGGVAVPWLVPAIALNFIDIWCQAVRLHVLLRHMSPPAPSRLFAALLVGIMGNNVLPMRMGMVLRAQYLSSRYGLQLTAMLSAMLLEGFMDGLVLAALFVPILLIVGSDTAVVWAVLVSGGAAAAGLIGLRLAYSPRWAARLRPLPALLRRVPVPRAVSRQVASWAAAFAEGVASVRSATSLAAAGLATVAAWLVTAAVYYTVGLAFSLDVDWTAYLVLTAAINVSGLLQASGGNVGPYEFVAAEVMAGFGADRGSAAAFAIVTHLVRLAPPTLVGLVLFAQHSVGRSPGEQTKEP